MSQTGVAPAPQEFGAPVPDFTLQRIGGGTESLDQYLAGKKGAVVCFWSGICSHCVRYDGYLNSFTERHPEIGLVVLASRHGEEASMIEATMKERGLKFPILHDPGYPVAKQYFTQQTPRVFLVDAEKRLLYRGAIDNFKFAGEPDYVPYLEPAIDAFLKGEPQPRTETASFGCAIMSVYYILPKTL